MKIEPKRLFLIDSLGAMLTAFLLAVVLARYESAFGVPPQTLYILSSVAGIFAIYSMVNYLNFNKKWRFYLQLIAWANLSYCVVTLGLVFSLHEKITTLGTLYFIGEIIIVVILAIVEIRTAKR